MKMRPARTRTFVVATTAFALLATAALAAPAQAAPTNNTATTSLEQVVASSPEAMNEEDLAAVGLTKADAVALQEAVTAALSDLEATGEVSSAEAAAFRESMLMESGTSTDSASVAALPVWAAAAIVGCAIGAVTGGLNAQIKNALKTGGIDSATDIAIDGAVDCVFGAVPGGAIGAAAKKALTGPIKTALRPPVKKAIEQMDD